jgi:hypothetical protein
VLEFMFGLFQHVRNNIDERMQDCTKFLSWGTEFEFITFSVVYLGFYTAINRHFMITN